MSAPTVAPLTDLVVLLGEGYRLATVELGQLSDPGLAVEWPEVRTVLAEHAAMKATLGGIVDGVKAGRAAKLTEKAIREVYAEAKRSTSPTEIEARPVLPVLGEVVEGLERIGEQLRRLYLTSEPVRAALDEVPGGWKP